MHKVYCSYHTLVIKRPCIEQGEESHVMTETNRTGFRRLAIAVAIPYLAFWAAVGILGYNSQDLVDQSLFWGAFLPAVLVTGIVVTSWVYKGFRPI